MNLEKQIFEVNATNFERLALEVFRFQYQHGSVYREYVDSLGVKSEDVQHLSEIPFLPIEFFKSQRILAPEAPVQQTFESSGTTGSINSKHYITKISMYEESLLKSFEQAFGKASNYCFLALLPNYLERQNSSLVYMVNRLMEESKHPNNGFYLYNHEELFEKLQELEAQGQPTLLFGVSFALLDFTEKYHLNLKHTKVVETGGMKGRRKEITREELHSELCQAFGTQQIHSEYGMTELLSQAYSQKEGIYHCQPWMQVYIREANDPFSYVEEEITGGINIIDLANLFSCSFIETKDLGRRYDDGSFSVLGRFDTSDIRGCNLMA
ncbi:acyl-protein synthetase LuxE [Balneicella halophila]|uniref:Acyl-protein synthetase LuxE n=1 Tax=Balneicella halophila TaxID=1537566 RepID=A0A7L4UN94_BALHA|nr:acyl transferase [Balneicella halophila]PVX49945.1 acyl-protein synthetase LuxE [Balneicella halophila]